ncbi:hypothetical protein [Pseudoblastomonas halimionae]|uniref:Secreted protein n=1 Tax=Alteriqipengyuania halimionae TaxID=1926630 RepID=A0A6I4U1K5_9SPHN|nr:hypothetical protein [Alteriqipengyuania halimionae]MXP09890.1 hypothetical protein [Alteriqipengyuania halimionae]
MKIVNTKVMAALLGASVLASAPVVAQDKSGTNKSETELELTDSGKMVEKAALGYRLAEYARANEDGQAMLVAARILKGVSLRDSDNKGEMVATGSGKADTGEDGAMVTADTLLDEAATFAADDDDLLDMIEETRAAENRGAVGGAIGLRRWVPSATAWNVDFSARGGEPLVIAAQRDSGTPVDLQVYDENGYLVCQDMSHNVVLKCRVDPAWTGPFRVKLSNHGGIGTGVQLVTN